MLKRASEIPKIKLQSEHFNPFSLPLENRDGGEMDKVWISLLIFEHKTAAYDEHVVKQGRVKHCQILVLMVREAHDIIIFGF